VAHRGRQLRKREIAGIAFAIYLASLSLFVLFPRPVLETGDPSQVAQYLETHANFFYKILYADTRLVALGNFLMLTPLPSILSAIYPGISLKKMFFFGSALSALFELTQLLIPGRVSDFVDFASNSLSVLLGIVIVRLLHRGKQVRTSHKPNL
jgi:glycopeptide antibiotics resistance protein